MTCTGHYPRQQDTWNCLGLWWVWSIDELELTRPVYYKRFNNWGKGNLQDQRSNKHQEHRENKESEVSPIFCFMRSCGKVGMSDIWGGCVLSSALKNTNPQEVQSQPASLDSCGFSCSQTSPTCATSRHLLVKCALGWAVCPCTASSERAVDGALGASNIQHYPSPPRDLWYLILVQPEMKHWA